MTLTTMGQAIFTLEIVALILCTCKYMNRMPCMLLICILSCFQMVVQWILKLVKTMTETSQLCHDPVSKVAELQVMGLVAITIVEAVLPKDTHSNLSADELEEVALLLGYRSIPLSKIQECQAVVCKYFSTMKW